MSDIIKILAESLKAATLDEMDDQVPRASTGCLVLDFLLDGGVPHGLITEIVGDYSTGKSLLGLQLCREVIKAGGVGIYLDSENAINKQWAVETLGIKPSTLICPTVVSLESGYDIINNVCQSTCRQKIPTIIVWDTIAATPAAAAHEGEGKNYSTIALAARINSERLSLIVNPLKRSGVALVLLNQLRSKIGIMFGQKWESCGGRAIRFYSSLRLHVTRIGKLKTNNKIYGVVGRVEIIKSRCGPPFRKVVFEIDFKRGIAPWSGMLELLKNADIISASGGVYSSEYISEPSFRAKDLPNLYKELWETAEKDLDSLKGALM